MSSVGTPLGWTLFGAIVLVMLVVDLVVHGRREGESSWKVAAAWSAVWISLAIAFGLGVGILRTWVAAGEFFTAFLLEKSLSVDNLFVFLLLFTFFEVPQTDRHRVLFWGVLGALLSRLIFIMAGAALLARFHAMTWIFGGVLLVTALRMFFRSESPEDPSKNFAVRIFRRFVPTTAGYHGHHFVVREKGRWLATPMLMVLVAIEATDIVFSFDSIPAVFGVTTDPFLVYTSNIFAILGLRALYSLVAGVLEEIEGLESGLALVLGYVGTKMLLTDVVHVPIALSFGMIAILLAAPPAFLWMRRHGLRRTVVLVTGSLVILAGIAMIVLPGPAILVIPAGLGILATEFHWARKVLAAVRAWIDRRRGKTPPP